MTRRIVTPMIARKEKQDAGTGTKLPARPARKSQGAELAAEAEQPSAPKLPEPDRSNEPRPGEQFGSEFLDNVAHQMIAPLQSIEMHCRNLLEGRVAEHRREQRLKEVLGHAKVLAEMAQRMRFLHQLISGTEISGERLPFPSIVTSWIDGANNYLPFAEITKIRVNVDDSSMNKLPDVVASPIGVHQVIMNLYDNGFKYGKPGSPIEVTARRDGAFVVNEFSHVAAVVMTDEAATRMFEERGYRAPEVRALRGSGTGVGMWISRRLMRAMQGDLRALPTNGGTTRFVLTWRLA